MRAFSSVPVMIGSLVECPRCRASVSRWGQDQHREYHEEQDQLAVRVAALAEYVAAGERLAVSPAAAGTSASS